MLEQKELTWGLLELEQVLPGERDVNLMSDVDCMCSPDVCTVSSVVLLRGSGLSGGGAQ